MNSTNAVKIFKALGDGKRLQIVNILGNRECSVGELEETLQLSQSATSQHLRLLKNAGLVADRKHGNFRIYSLQRNNLREAMHFFDQFWDSGLEAMKAKLEQHEE